MPDIKISDLTAATAASGAMQLEVNDSLSSKKVTVDQLKAYVLPAASITTTQLATSAVNLATQVSGVLPVTNGGSGVSTSTGSGNNVLSNSPTLVSPALGTPASGNLANCSFPTLNQNTTGTASNVTGVVAVANGGTGTAAPSLVAGSNITITGSFPNQTIAASGGGGLVGYTVFTASGSYTKATNNPTAIFVEVIGGGSGGAGGSGASGAGGTSSFGAFLSATGGVAVATNSDIGGVGGIGSNGQINLRGGGGQGSGNSAYVNGNMGGNSVYGGGANGQGNAVGAANTGGGGSGRPGSASGKSQYPGGPGGGAGGYAGERLLASSLAASETVTVGAGGAGNAQGGGAGGSGIVIVWEYK